jgi:hypothetical protein
VKPSLAWIVLPLAAFAVGGYMAGWVAIDRIAQLRSEQKHFVLRSEIGAGSASLVEAANAAVRADLRRAGYLPSYLAITKERIDGDTATVTELVRFYPAGDPNAPQHEQEVVLIFHRGVWQLSQQNNLARPSS